MPGIIFLNRRWNFASDDLFYPGLIELISRSVWFTPQLIYYIYYKELFNCPDAQLLHIYYIGFLCTMGLIIFVQLWIVLLSAQGTITNSRPRRHMVKFIYMRTLLSLTEICWSIVGSIWIVSIKMAECSQIVYFAVICNLAFCGIAVFFLIIVIFIVFDPLSHLDEKDVVKKRNILNYYINKMCCCFYCCLHTGNSRQANYENSYKQISAMLEMIFRNGDLTPSDIAAGIILINNKEVNQFKREFKSKTNSRKQTEIRKSLINAEKIPKWMDINEASYFIRFALATYSWPYYLYMHNMRGFCDICCICSTANDEDNEGCCGCCNCQRKRVQVNEPEYNQANNKRCVCHGDTRTRRNLRAFKFLSKTEECDIIYSNFSNELFLVPFCVLVDHFKKTVIITIRGTLSMRDVITDMTAECGYFDIDDLQNQPAHIGILNTADNIYQIIKEENLLGEAFKTNPNYQLTVTGHSLGAGTATILAMKLKNEYPDIRCIAYSPPGGLISEALSDYTKSFVMSVIVGDDIVPRLSLHSVHNLKAEILKEIYNTNLPKYKIIWKYSLSFVKRSNDEEHFINYSSSGEESDEDTTLQTVVNMTSNPENEVLVDEIHDHLQIESDQYVDENHVDSNSTVNLFRATTLAIQEQKQKLKREASNLFTKSTNLVEIDDFNESENPNEPIKSKEVAYSLIKRMKHHVKETYPTLVLPGNILYIYQIQSSVKKSCFKSIGSTVFCCFDSCQSADNLIYDSRWAHRDEFKKIVITNRMLLDHFPNQVDNALNYFHSTKRYI